MFDVWYFIMSARLCIGWNRIIKYFWLWYQILTTAVAKFLQKNVNRKVIKICTEVLFRCIDKMPEKKFKWEYIYRKQRFLFYHSCYGLEVLLQGNSCTLSTLVKSTACLGVSLRFRCGSKIEWTLSFRTFTMK